MARLTQAPEAPAAISLADVRDQAGFEYKLALARLYGAPLDGGGRTLNLAPATTLELGHVRLRNVRLNLSSVPQAGAAFASTGSRTLLTSTFAASKFSTQVTIPAHGLALGDLVHVEDPTQNWNPVRSYYLAGDAGVVLRVVDANTVVLSRALRFTYAAANVYRVTPARGGLENVELVGPNLNTMGVQAKYHSGVLTNNLTVRGFGERAIEVSASQSTLIAPQVPAITQTATGTNYGIVVLDLSDVDILAPQIAGGRHTISSGGSYPNTINLTGGYLRGGAVDREALDAHGATWALRVNGTHVEGGINSSALITELRGVRVESGIFDRQTLFWGYEAPAGASLYVSDANLVNLGTSRQTLNLNRSTVRNEGGVMPDVRYGEAVFDNVMLSHTTLPGAAITLNDMPVSIDVSLERLVWRGVRPRSTNPNANVNVVNADRIGRLDLELESDGYAWNLRGTGTAGALTGTPSMNLRARLTNSGPSTANTVPALKIAGSAANHWNVRLDVESDACPASAVELSGAGRARVKLTSRNSGQYGTTSAYKAALVCSNIDDLRVTDTEIEEGGNCDYGLILSNCPAARLARVSARSNLTPISTSGTTTVTRRDAVYTAGGAAALAQYVAPDGTLASPVAVAPLGTRNGTEAPSAFPAGEEIVSVPTASAASLPAQVGGTLTTVKAAGTGAGVLSYTFQTYQLAGSGRRFMRAALSTDAWTAWIELAAVQPSLTYQVPAQNVPAASTLTVVIDFPGVAVGQNINAAPQSSIEAGVSWTAFAHVADKIQLRIVNPTAAAIATVARNWKFKAV